MWLFAGKFGVDAWIRIGSSAGGVALAIALFRYRQSLDEDDGFLAITLHSLGALLRGTNREAAHLPAASRLERQARREDLTTHWLWGSAARKYGVEAAEGPRAVLRILSIFILISFFWMTFGQHSSTWVEQAKQLDRDLGFWNPLPSQIQAFNPILVMILIPIMAFGVFPLVERLGVRVTPLRKMSVGMLLAGVAFVIVAQLQERVEAEGIGQVSFALQLPAWILITLSEVLVSITGLEFAYSQAPRRMKSIVMSFWLLCASIGHWLVAVLAHRWASGDLSQTFWNFTYLVAGAAAIFTVRAAFYRYRDYTQ
jgi:POT family proton-dependent oligopeptide transporter